MLKNPKSIRFLHLVDHNGPIFDLISPLSYFKEHKILTSFYKPFKETMKQIEKMAEDNDITVILHATGNKKRFYKEKDKIFKIFKKNC